MSPPGYFTRRAKSFRHAFAGLTSLHDQPNVVVHTTATLFVVAAGLALGLGPLEWALVTLAVSSVWVAEALNTAVERLADAAVPERHPLVGAAKDVAAGAVLAASIGAAVVGGLVFVPRLAELFR